jgi:AraC family transcriptional activator of pobA
VLIDRPALVFSNPLIPYFWEPISAEQGGYLCLFTEEFLIINGRAASLQESPLFRLGSDPVYLVNETQYADLSHLFGKMLQEMNSGYLYQQATYY